MTNSEFIKAFKEVLKDLQADSPEQLKTRELTKFFVDNLAKLVAITEEADKIRAISSSKEAINTQDLFKDYNSLLLAIKQQKNKDEILKQAEDIRKGTNRGF